MSWSYPLGSRRRADFWGFGGLLVLVGLVASFFAFQAHLVVWQPRLAGLYRAFGSSPNPLGLAFDGVHLVQDVQNGRPGLVVEGEIRILMSRNATIPAIRLALLDAEGQELLAWTAEAGPADSAAGDRVRFRTRVPSVPPGARQIDVRFADGSRVEGSR